MNTNLTPVEHHSLIATETAPANPYPMKPGHFYHKHFHPISIP